MNIYRSILKYTAGILFFAIVLFTMSSCGSSETPARNPGYVIIHQKAEPASLNPTNSRGAESTAIYYNVTQELVNADFQTMEIVPVLAKERAKFAPIAGSDLIAMSFEIREEAKWDNGTPITGEDIAFSLKTIIVPQTNCGHKKPYFEFIKDLKIDKDNPRKITFIGEPYMLAEAAMSDLHILPKYFYDEKGLLDGYNIAELADTSEAMRSKFDKDSVLIAFGEHFNGAAFEKEKIVGSGAYALDTWIPNERIILRRKKDWWGDAVKNGGQWFEAYPDTIIYEIIPDDATAFASLRADKVNTMYSIAVDDYVAAKKDTSFTNKFYTFEPPIYAYDFVGFNHRKPMFQDLNTRKAFAHLMNVQELIKTAADGFAEQVACFSHPSSTEFLNPAVKPYAYDLALAKEFLKKGGWEDLNNDGILEKEIGGKRVDFKCKILTNANNSRRVQACQVLADAAKKVGIVITPEAAEWTEFIKKTYARDFDLLVLGLASSPFESDPYQSWHSASAASSSNHSGYSNVEVDKIIEKMRKLTNREERLPYYHQLHQYIHDDVAVVFLMSLNERMAISKNFQNVWASGMKPGFWAPGFKLSE